MIEKPYLYEAEEGKKQRHKEEGNVKIEAETGLLKPQSQKTQGIPETGTCSSLAPLELIQSCLRCELRLLPPIKAKSSSIYFSHQLCDNMLGQLQQTSDHGFKDGLDCCGPCVALSSSFSRLKDLFPQLLGLCCILTFSQ